LAKNASWAGVGGLGRRLALVVDPAHREHHDPGQDPEDDDDDQELDEREAVLA
jgi:hypothetical protein